MICTDCKGEIILGETHELRIMKTNADGSLRIDRIEYRCWQCSEDLAWMMWDEEEMGPFPHWRLPAGHA